METGKSVYTGEILKKMQEVKKIENQMVQDCLISVYSYMVAQALFLEKYFILPEDLHGHLAVIEEAYYHPGKYPADEKESEPEVA